MQSWGQIFNYCDADSQHDTNDMGILLDHLKNGLDIVTTKKINYLVFQKVFLKMDH